MFNPLVSVIVPAYNAQLYLVEALQSILEQTYQQIEIIVLDDASTDDTLLIARQFSIKDSRIKVVSNDKNLYIAGNRNKGISLAKGKYIVWQDADDISLPLRIEKLVNLMESDSSIGLAGSNIQVFDEHGDKEVREYSTDDVELRKCIFKYSPVAQPAAIVRKACFDAVGVFNEAYPPAEDLDLSFRVGCLYKFGNVNETLLRYRLSPTNQTYRHTKKMIVATLSLRRKYAKGYCYKMSFTDYIAYILTYLSKFLPPRMMYMFFKFARKLSRIANL